MTYTQRILLPVLLCLPLIGCHTLLEEASLNRPIYQAEKNNQGETVYRSYETSSPILTPQKLSLNTEPIADDKFNNVVESSKTTSQPLALFFELASGDSNTHIGLHSGLPIWSELLIPRVGLSAFFSNSETYLGFDGSVRFRLLKAKISPFVGLGLYLGDTKKCTQDLYYGQTCEKKFLTAGYGEVGLKYENLHLFWRDYNITRAGLNVPTDGIWGIGISSAY